MQDGLVALRTCGAYRVGKGYPPQSYSRQGPRPAISSTRSCPRSSSIPNPVQYIPSGGHRLVTGVLKAVAVKEREGFGEVMLSDGHIQLRDISPHIKDIRFRLSCLRSFKQGEEAPQVIKGIVSCYIDLSSHTGAITS